MGTRNKTKDKESLSPEAERLLIEAEERLLEGDSVERILLDLEDKYWDELWPEVVMVGYLCASSPAHQIGQIRKAVNAFFESKNVLSRKFALLTIIGEKEENGELHLKIIAK